MEIKPIRTDDEHRAALAEIESLWDCPDGSPEADRLEVLAMLVDAYEQAHHPISAPNPVEYVMNSRGLTRRDMEPYIGPRGRVSDVLNRVRPLSLGIIRRLSEGLSLPANVLIQPYPLRVEAT